MIGRNCWFLANQHPCGSTVKPAVSHGNLTEVAIAHLCASLRFSSDMIILHPLQLEVDYLSSELQGLPFGQSFFVGSHVSLSETVEKDAHIARKFGRLAIGWARCECHRYLHRCVWFCWKSVVPYQYVFGGRSGTGGWLGFRVTTRTAETNSK